MSSPKDPVFAVLGATALVEGRLEHAESPALTLVTLRPGGRADRFDFGAEQLVEEFVPAGDHLIGTTLNLAAGASELRVFGARRIADGPLASWRSDVALPLSFHGSWVARAAS